MSDLRLFSKDARGKDITLTVPTKMWESPSDIQKKAVTDLKSRGFKPLKPGQSVEIGGVKYSKPAAKEKQEDKKIEPTT